VTDGEYRMVGGEPVEVKLRPELLIGAKVSLKLKGNTGSIIGTLKGVSDSAYVTENSKGITRKTPRDAVESVHHLRHAPEPRAHQNGR
jgi:hypothetical protein